MTSESPVLTVEEAATLLRLSRGSAYEGVRTGAIPSIRVGRRVLIPKARLDALLAGQDAAAPEKVAAS
ncbi:MAG: helix-turn-helix domain-containing protein [Dehalococcoidia bacterium]